MRRDQELTNAVGDRRTPWGPPPRASMRGPPPGSDGGGESAEPSRGFAPGLPRGPGRPAAPTGGSLLRTTGGEDAPACFDLRGCVSYAPGLPLRRATPSRLRRARVTIREPSRSPPRTLALTGSACRHPTPAAAPTIATMSPTQLVPACRSRSPPAQIILTSPTIATISRGCRSSRATGNLIGSELLAAVELSRSDRARVACAT